MSLISIANLLILISSVIWFIHLIPQIMKTVKLKDVNGLSITFYIMSTIAYLLFIFGIALKQDWIVVFSQIPAYLCNITMLALIMKYKKKPRKVRARSKSKISRTDARKAASIKYKGKK